MKNLKLGFMFFLFLSIWNVSNSQNSIAGCWILQDVSDQNISKIKKEDFFETQIEFRIDGTNEVNFFASTFFGLLRLSGDSIKILKFYDYRTISSLIINLNKIQETNFQLMNFYKLEGNKLYLFDKTKRIKMVYTRRAD